jgi:hypothetical protein
MFTSGRISMGIFAVGFITTFFFLKDGKISNEQLTRRHYLRVSVAHWKINTYSPEAEKIFQQIATEASKYLVNSQVL